MRIFKKIVLLMILSPGLHAAPTGADVLAACEEALEKGFHGTRAMMCVWYVTPCDCHHGKDSAIPRVCLPDGKAAETLAREVIDGLKSQPDLLSESAEVSAGVILAVKYPCN